MIRYRPFRNTDPPAIAEIWRSQPPSRALVQPMSPDLLEQHVLSKLYFDRAGFILAEEAERPVGFVHAAFGANESGSAIDQHTGVTCIVMAIPHEQHDQLVQGLLEQSEQYLRSRGASQLYGGGFAAVNPFYLGLYGGSQLPGILDSDTELTQLFHDAGYRPEQSNCVLQRRISDFRPIVDRQQMQIRRRYQITASFDPPPKSWWDACVLSQLNCTHFQVSAREGGESIGTATFWDVEPLASSWGIHAGGLLEFEMEVEHRTQGIGLFLLGEAMRQLQSHGITMVEVQIPADQPIDASMYQRLGFEQVDKGTVFEK